MRHLNKKKILDRQRDARRALVKGLLVNFCLHGKMQTTKVRGRVIKSAVEKLITRAKKNDLASRRYLLSRLGSEVAVNRLLKEIAPKYLERKGGYTRLIKMGYRAGDSAEMVKLELI